MANPELGTKQVCPNCQAKFYDLNKRPAHCPKCASEFDPDEAIRNRRVRARATVPEAEADTEDQVKTPKDADEDDDEDVGAPELDEVTDDVPLVSDDDDDDSDAPAAVSENLGEFTDEDDVEEADDVPFLEEEDDDDFEDEIEGLPGEGEDDR